MSVAAKAAIKAPRATDLLAAIVPFSVRVRLLVASAGAEFLPADFAASRKTIYLFVRRRIQGEKGLWMRPVQLEKKWKHHSCLFWCAGLFAMFLFCRLHISCSSSEWAARHSSAEYKHCSSSLLQQELTRVAPCFSKRNPSVHHDDAMQATASQTYFFLCVWVLLGRTLTWIFQAYFLSSLLLFTRSDWWVTEPTFECRNQKKNKDPLGNNCTEITEALCKAESAL